MNSVVGQEQSLILEKIASAQSRLRKLEMHFQEEEEKLEQVQAEAPKYESLTRLIEHLQELDELGGSHLVWGEECSQEQSASHFERLQAELTSYDESIAKLQQEKSRLTDQVRQVKQEISLLGADIQEIHERAEERENEFVVERELAERQYRPLVMPWTARGEDEKRYRKIMLIAMLMSLLLGYLVPLWDLPEPKRAEVIEIPERLAKLLVKKEPPKPKPKVEPKPQDLPEKEKKPDKKTKKPEKPKPEEVKVARKKAESAGILAFKNNFAELMDNPADEKLGANANISTKGQTARRTQRSIVVANVAGASGGINTASLSRDVAGSGKNIGDVSFSRVESSIGSDFFGEDRQLSDGPGPSRTDEEIQIVFDRYKAALYRIYNRQLRTDPTLQGKIVLRITIEPDGSVSLCKVESSDMNSPALDEGIVARVTRFNFGPKEGVPTVTILYPIDFLPAS